MMMQKVLDPRDDIKYMCHEKKEKEDSTELKIASIQRLENDIKREQ